MANKELLLKDLCSRLPYGVICQVTLKTSNGKSTTGNYKLVNGMLNDYWIEYNELKPYLRPLTSMTKDELDELYSLRTSINKIYKDVLIADAYIVIDWLNERHFDYRGLIPKNLAIAITKDNDPYKVNN